MSERVASMPDSKALYGVSGWIGQYWWYTYHEYEDGSHTYDLVSERDAPFQGNTYPAYDVAFLLQHLPAVELYKQGNGSYRALWWDHTNDSPLEGESRTNAANALCRLALVLFRHGILKGDKA